MPGENDRVTDPNWDSWKMERYLIRSQSEAPWAPRGWGRRSGQDEPEAVSPQKGTHPREVFPVLPISRNYGSG